MDAAGTVALRPSGWLTPLQTLWLVLVLSFLWCDVVSSMEIVVLTWTWPADDQA